MGYFGSEADGEAECGRRCESSSRRVPTTSRSSRVRMTAGSDSPWGWYAPGEFVHEIDMLARAGLPYADAIVAGTSGSVESIGVGAVAGRLAPGRQADVLVVRGDPAREITAL
jgi:imidazolonepropionase-like amidohydrolase